MGLWREYVRLPRLDARRRREGGERERKGRKREG